MIDKLEALAQFTPGRRGPGRAGAGVLAALGDVYGAIPGLPDSEAEFEARAEIFAIGNEMKIVLILHAALFAILLNT